MMNQKIGVEIRQIQEEFACDELKAVNILLQLIAHEDAALVFEEDLAETWLKAA